jgi:hypothetical protein
MVGEFGLGFSLDELRHKNCLALLAPLVGLALWQPDVLTSGGARRKFSTPPLPPLPPLPLTAKRRIFAIFAN